MSDYLKDTPLGKETQYVDQYDPEQLHPIPRELSREGLGIEVPLPFQGEDIWNAYEVSWLDATGKPQVAMVEVRVPAHSPALVESKSFKLYFNAFANSRFSSWEQVQQHIQEDVSKVTGAPVTVVLRSLAEAAQMPLWQSQGQCLDGLPLLEPADAKHPTVGAEWLQLAAGEGQEKAVFYSHLVRSLCPVTGQPDWATIEIGYEGRPWSPQHLLQYLVSFRQSNGFHERVVEQAFMDIQQRLQPTKLWVRARYTRRGGLDINPYRSSHPMSVGNEREVRQ